MQFDKVIKGGAIVTASDTTVADIGIIGEKISTIGLDLPDEGAQVIEAKGRYVFPGCVDVHTHLDMPFGGTFSSDNYETGTAAAAWGGTTTLIDFAIQSRGKHLQEGLDAWHQKSQGKAFIDYSFHMIISDLPESRVEEMDRLVDQGVASFKLFMAYPGVFMVDDATMFRALLRTRENGGLICVHAENGGVIDVLVKQALAQGHTAPKYHALTRPMSAEAEATRRAIFLAELAGVPIYIVHLSAGDALDAVAQARDRGVPVFAETCPQYLFLSYDDYERPGFEGAKFVMSPPLRPKGNEERLWRGLNSNNLQVVSTDHCPFCFDKPQGKRLGEGDFSQIPNGAPGVETRLHLLYDGGVNQGRFSVNRMVDLLATTPARLFGLYPQKGTIAPGSDADLVIFDPDKKHRISHETTHMNVDYSPYEGREVTGAVESVLLRGKVILDKGAFAGRAGDGRFIKRSPSEPSSLL